MALARMHPLLLHFSVQIVELELGHYLMRRLLELPFVFCVKYVLTAWSVQNLKQFVNLVGDSRL